MTLDGRPALPMIGGLLITCVGYSITYFALSTIFLGEPIDGFRQIVANPTEFIEAVVMLCFIYTAVMLTLHLSGVPRPWRSLNRVALALLGPYLIWVLALIAWHTSEFTAIKPLFGVVGHPLWFVVFLLIGLGWWTILMAQDRRRLLLTGCGD